MHNIAVTTIHIQIFICTDQALCFLQTILPQMINECSHFIHIFLRHRIRIIDYAVFVRHMFFSIFCQIKLLPFIPGFAFSGKCRRTQTQHRRFFLFSLNCIILLPFGLIPYTWRRTPNPLFLLIIDTIEPNNRFIFFFINRTGITYKDRLLRLFQVTDNIAASLIFKINTAIYQPHTKYRIGSIRIGFYFLSIFTRIIPEYYTVRNLKIPEELLRKFGIIILVVLVHFLCDLVRSPLSIIPFEPGQTMVCIHIHFSLIHMNPLAAARTRNRIYFLHFIALQNIYIRSRLNLHRFTGFGNVRSYLAGKSV